MNEERKAMMKECRKYYDIFSEDEEKVIIYPHKDIWSMDGVMIRTIGKCINPIRS